MTDVGARLLGKAFATKALPPECQELKIDQIGDEGPTLTEEGRDALRKGLEEGGWLSNPLFKCSQLEEEEE